MAKKFLLLGNFTNEEIVKIMQKVKEVINIEDVIFATLTETVKEWKVKDWLKELEEEDAYFKKQKSNK
ncbi:DUF3783 domain-containing protein [Caldisericum exile]|uniref:DUF3783 domain-containing protein n=1 Tax=Caldisericum exile (strain DSM 21853 / NBRC 104410 / AZM16c01) TaxID=511051 RepID=A0A7U6JGD9_CALEA|nr:DUF3783 domain-containing protein [Caldisericum exile]BAL81350.1 hypothetical protein CSE_12240 [Caldisericum exile AZM16c01]